MYICSSTFWGHLQHIIDSNGKLYLLHNDLSSQGYKSSAQSHANHFLFRDSTIHATINIYFKEHTQFSYLYKPP